MPEAQQKALLPWTAALGAAQPLVSDSSYPFCFLYGGQPSSTLLPRWEFSAATPRLLPDFSGRTIHSFSWSEPPQDEAGAGGSTSRCVVDLNVTLFAAQPTAADAVLALRNVGSSPTAVVTRPGTLSAAWASPTPTEPARLFTRVGGNGGPRDFYPACGKSGPCGSTGADSQPPALVPGGKPHVLQNQCGTGSFGTLPFFQMEWPQQRTGLLVSLGWSGQWLASVERSASGVTSVWAGLGGQQCPGAPGSVSRGLNDEYPRFSVVPGERLRLLRALTIAYGSHTDATLHHTGLNLHRRIILDSIAPRAFQTPGRWPWNTSAPPPPPPAPTPPGYSMVLVSATGFPHGQFNHEAIGATTEAQCKYTCLMNYRTCKAVSWLPRPTEPCVHYQTLTDDKVSPLTGCRYWKVVHNDTTTVAAAAQHFKALSPIYPLVAAISNKNNHAWDTTDQSGNLDLLAAIRKVPGEEELWIDVGWSTGGTFGGNYAQPIQDSVDSTEWPSRSLAPVFGAGHDTSDGKRNVQSVLWFMPEMNVNASCALPGWGKAGWCSTPEPSYLVAHHPDWLAWDGPTGSGKTSLVDLGIPEAREYTVDFLTDAIGSWQIDTFRIESSCNGGQDCVVFFQDHDRTYQQRKYPGVARNGTTEIGHTLGLHAVFDEIRMRHPGLVVDVCAGGGRKIDLDIMERSVQK